MTKERDVFISVQQWATAKNIEMTPEVKNAVFLLWRDLHVEINLYKNRTKSLEKGLARAKDVIETYKRLLKRG